MASGGGSGEKEERVFFFPRFFFLLWIGKIPLLSKLLFDPLIYSFFNKDFFSF